MSALASRTAPSTGLVIASVGWTEKTSKLAPVEAELPHASEPVTSMVTSPLPTKVTASKPKSPPCTVVLATATPSMASSSVDSSSMPSAAPTTSNWMPSVAGSVSCRRLSSVSSTSGCNTVITGTSLSTARERSTDSLSRAADAGCTAAAVIMSVSESLAPAAPTSSSRSSAPSTSAASSSSVAAPSAPSCQLTATLSQPSPSATSTWIATSKASVAGSASSLAQVPSAGVTVSAHGVVTTNTVLVTVRAGSSSTLRATWAPAGASARLCPVNVTSATESSATSAWLPNWAPSIVRVSV